jgi:hypothetical protein
MGSIKLTPSLAIMLLSIQVGQMKKNRRESMKDRDSSMDKESKRVVNRESDTQELFRKKDSKEETSDPIFEDERLNNIDTKMIELILSEVNKPFL